MHAVSPTGCYPVAMTTVEIVFHYAVAPSEPTALALGRARDVYGIRGLKLDRQARTLRIEYDATRLTEAAVSKLVRQAGLDVVESPPENSVGSALPPAPAA